MIKVSIIVPVFQVEKYISRCLRSLVYQTIRDIEIICICSKEDSSYSIIQEWCKSDSRIHLIEKKNTGVSSARNLGIAKANGEYIAFVDADDWVEKHAMEVLYKVAVENKADIVSYGMWPNIEPHGSKRAIFGYFPKRDVKYSEQCLRALFYEHGGRPYIGNKFYNRIFLKEHNIHFDEDMVVGEDQFLQFEAFRRAHTVCYIKEKLYHYDISRNNSAMNQCEQRQAVLTANMLLLDKVLRWKESMLDKQYDADFVWWILQDFAGWILECNAVRQKEIAKILYRELQKIEVEEHIKTLPSVYHEIYLMIRANANDEVYDNEYVLDSHLVDAYMAGKTREIKQKLVVEHSIFRRLKEAWNFHETRHFIIRVLVRLGVWK